MLLPLRAVAKKKKITHVGAPYRFVKRIYFFRSVAAFSIVQLAFAPL